MTEFANNDLSGVFCGSRKDRLYCGAPSSQTRRAYRTVLDTLFHALVRWASPILCFTAEEVWQTRFPDDQDSVHLLEWPEISDWTDAALGEIWASLRDLRKIATLATEPFRRDKTPGSSLEAEVNLRTEERRDGEEWD